jgi:hypothetical protein
MFMTRNQTAKEQQTRYAKKILKTVHTKAETRYLLVGLHDGSQNEMQAMMGTNVCREENRHHSDEIGVHHIAGCSN